MFNPRNPLYRSYLLRNRPPPSAEIHPLPP